MNDTLLTAEGSTETNDNIKLVDIPQVWTIIIVAIMVIVVMLTIVGNIAVMVVLCCSNVLNSIVNSHFLISLSIADLLVATLVMPCALDAVNTGTWRCGQIWGMFNGFGNFLFCISSIMHLALLSVDRYIAISRPLVYLSVVTKPRARIACLLLWIYSTLWALPPLFGVSSYECFIPYIGKCLPEDWLQNKVAIAFTVSVVCGTYGVAVIIMCYVYFKIFIVIFKQLKRISVTVEQVRRNSLAAKRNASTRKGVTTVLIVIGTYVACWSPFCILLFVQMARGKTAGGQTADIITMFIGFANSACNPIIYCIRYRAFRETVKRIFVRKSDCFNVFFKEREQTQISTRSITL